MSVRRLVKQTDNDKWRDSMMPVNKAHYYVKYMTKRGLTKGFRPDILITAISLKKSGKSKIVANVGKAL